MSESCAPTSEEESSDEEHSDDDDEGGEETSEILTCDKLTAVKPENLYENDEKEMDGYNIKSLFEKEEMKDNESTCGDDRDSSITRTSSVESSSFLFEIRVDEADSDNEVKREDESCCGHESGSDCGSNYDSEIDCCSEQGSDCECDCDSDCDSVSGSDSNCQSECEKEGESVTDNVVWYRFAEECNECVLSEENKKNFAKLTEGWTIKKRVSVVDSDDEW